MDWVDNWLNIIQDYWLPPTCLLCGNAGERPRDLCQACYGQLLRPTQHCYQCAEPLPSPSAVPLRCGRCISRRPAFDETHAAFVYDDALRYLVTGLKFAAHYKNARLLGHLLAETVRQNAETPQLLIPVPLHKHRYRQRGFNQSLEIARTVAHSLNIPLRVDACQRCHDTPQQSRLNAKQRRQNLRHAFVVAKPLNVRHVAIIDDVMTTGSTVHEVAKVLKKAGVERVDVWVCARA
ncbi:ComF family protein [Methylovulum psychrotolerans]|uniref:Phosphoribosyltransferase n=1 Tax=Methylovulum psychrotolerans TaxID=1704499 RepID=A0A1Z4C4J0_9GAMM|nr:ComF family protein [Methylovulum psychrotolerans]ASF48453.1 phosphoribosyltransferase [Methylovulum psychrotolerans]